MKKQYIKPTAVKVAVKGTLMHTGSIQNTTGKCRQVYRKTIRMVSRPVLRITAPTSGTSGRINPQANVTPTFLTT